MRKEINVMGMDMTMDIVNKNGQIMEEDIFDGRCSEWFRNMQGYGDDMEYEHLPVDWDAPEGVLFNEKARSEDGYFDFRYINVDKYLKWFEKYKPDVDAGWATTYEQWLMENKEYHPEYLPHSLSHVENVVLEDMHFVTYSKTNDCSRWLYHHLREYSSTREDLWIRYCFDW